jgi:hypothetical protein
MVMVSIEGNKQLTKIKTQIELNNTSYNAQKAKQACSIW